jgi:hypothetical protein
MRVVGASMFGPPLLEILDYRIKNENARLDQVFSFFIELGRLKFMLSDPL